MNEFINTVLSSNSSNCIDRYLMKSHTHRNVIGAGHIKSAGQKFVVVCQLLMH